MTLPTQHNKVITVAGEIVKTFMTLAIYVALCAIVIMALLWLGITCGEMIHDLTH